MEMKEQTIVDKYARLGVKPKILAELNTCSTKDIEDILDGDATVSMLLIPMGLYITFTKELILYDSDVEKLRELKRELREEREVAQW